MSPLGREPGWLRIVFVVLLFSATILAISIATLMYFGKKTEAKYVDKTKYQAVFLTNGQVYFGHIDDANSRFIDLQNVFYLNTQQQNADGTTRETADSGSSFSLVKLGCELHGPADQMIINADQVTFWENIRTDGKVAKAIAKWKTSNPKGMDCDAQPAAETSTDQSPATEPTTRPN